MAHIENIEEIIEALTTSNSFLILVNKGDNISIVHQNMDTILACDMVRGLISTIEEEMGGRGKYSPELKIASLAVKTFLERVVDPKGHVLAEGITAMLNKERWN